MPIAAADAGLGGWLWESLHRVHHTHLSFYWYAVWSLTANVSPNHAGLRCLLLNREEYDTDAQGRIGEAMVGSTRRDTSGVAIAAEKEKNCSPCAQITTMSEVCRRSRRTPD